MDIKQMLGLSESKTLEFKRDLTSTEPILKTLVAFANTAGGTLIIGRDDNGTIVGVQNVLNEEEKLSNIISDSISPPLLPEIDIASIEGHSLLIVSVSRWRGPFYLKRKGEIEGAYIRLGSTNRKAGPEILEEIKRLNTKKTFDQSPCFETGLHDLNMNQIKEVFSRVGKEVDRSKLKTMGLLVEYNGQLVCSNAGIILFGKQDIREHIFPNSQVRCARFRGEDKVHFIDQLDMQGSILDALLEVPKFIDRNTKLSSEITNSHRIDIPEYSPVIIREVLTNALAHADYSLRGFHPRVSIFSDRLEIESPGMLPLGYLLEDFFSGVSHIRNKVIARVFRELNLMEEWGTGFKRIKYVCDQENYPLPNWEEVGSVVRVSLGSHDASLTITRKSKTKINFAEKLELTTRQEEIVQILDKYEMLTTKDLHKKLKCPISERTLRGDLMVLKKNNIIKMLGKGPSTQWKISKN